MTQIHHTHAEQLDPQGRFDARRFVQVNSPWIASVNLTSLERLAESCEEIKSVSVEMRGSIMRDVGPLLQLSVSAGLVLMCERCLRSFDYECESSTEIIIADDNNEADRIALYVDEKYEVLVASEVQSALQLVEDELLLAIPFSPRCTTDCGHQNTVDLE